MQPIHGDGPQSISLMHLVACQELQAEIERAMAERNGTAPLVIDGALVPQAQRKLSQVQKRQPNDEPRDLYAPALE